MPRLPPGPPPRLPKLPERPGPGPLREYPRPGYAQRFRCISEACEENCCHGWGVPIDQATYEKYRSVEEMKPHLGKLIVLNTKRPTTHDYARIPQLTDGSCPFLTGNRLCGIHQKYGPEMLSVTCSTYPRAISTNAGQVEEALNLSCPEAARLTLLDPNLLDSVSHSSAIWRAAGAERYAAVRLAAGKPDRLYDPRLAIREFVLLMLTDRSYPLWQRLYQLGILARRLDGLRGKSPVSEWSVANPAPVAKLLSDSARVAVLERLRPAMDAIQAQPDQQLQLLMELLRLRIAQPPVAVRFLECVQDFELGLGCAAAKSEQEILDAYAEGYRRYYLPLMERHPQVMENYVANYVFKNYYPFGRPRHVPLPPEQVLDAESEHLLLSVHAALAQMLLIGMARRYREEFGVEHVVKLVQSLARTIEHSAQFLEQITAFVRTKNLSNLKGFAVLLRQDA
jgi:lysine-N-methylase